MFFCCFVWTVFKRSPSIPKIRAYKKMVEVACPAVVLVALSTAIRRVKWRVVLLCRLLMSANIGKHGTGCKPCDAHQHFIQNDFMANKTQRFVRCVHCINAFKKGVLVFIRPSMCEGKRTSWSHTCVGASSTKCRTCRCLIRSPTHLKLNIPVLAADFVGDIDQPQ